MPAGRFGRWDRMTPLTAAALTAVLAFALTGSTAAAPAARAPAPVPVPAAAPTGAGTAPLDGYDISWPNCPKGMGIPQRRTAGLPMPPAGARMVIIGLTNGPGFYPNPCLADQVRWARTHRVLTGAYAVASMPRPAELARYGRSGPWPGTDTASRLRNAGHAQARFNLDSAARAGLPTPHVWIDVETVRGWPWSDPAANRALLEGVVRGYTSAGVEVGFYSYRGAWDRITGGLRTGHPVWTTGATTRAGALARCSRTSFSGGPVLLSQWYVPAGKVDHDVTCPRPEGPTDRLRRMFTQF
jgi:hypothetical protein